MADDNLAPLPALTLGRSLWAITDSMLGRLADVHRVAAAPGIAQLADRIAAKPRAARHATGRTAGMVAVVSLTGILTPRGSLLSLLFGGGAGGLMGFREEFAAAIADSEVGAVVLDVDSPGGGVDLVPETAADIREARGQKPIVAVANTLAASGAYWIAAQADEVVITPSGEAGSIGVYMVHEGWSGFNEKMGIVPTYISAGKYKTEGNLDEPLSDVAREAWQGKVDSLYTMFVDDVAAGRGVSADQVVGGYGEGRSLLAVNAVEAGLADRVATMDDVLGDLLGSGGESTTSAAALARIEAESARIDKLIEAQEAINANTRSIIDAGRDSDLDAPPEQSAETRSAIASLLLAAPARD